MTRSFSTEPYQGNKEAAETFQFDDNEDWEVVRELAPSEPYFEE